jgi:hypothetical protein
MISDMGDICPSSQDAEKPACPLVFYCVDPSTSMEDMYARYWKRWSVWNKIRRKVWPDTVDCT